MKLALKVAPICISFTKISRVTYSIVILSHSGEKGISSGNQNASGHCGQVLVL